MQLVEFDMRELIRPLGIARATVLDAIENEGRTVLGAAEGDFGFGVVGRKLLAQIADSDAVAVRHSNVSLVVGNFKVDRRGEGVESGTCFLPVCSAHELFGEAA